MNLETAYRNVTIDFTHPEHGRIFKSLRYKASGFKTYFNAQHLFLQLSTKERCFLDYLVENMDGKNRVMIDRELKMRYIRFLEDITHEQSQGKGTGRLDKYTQKLETVGLLLTEGTRAFYCVNPKYIWRSNEEGRMKLLKHMVTDRIARKLTIEPLLEMPLSEFLVPFKSTRGDKWDGREYKELIRKRAIFDSPTTSGQMLGQEEERGTPC